MNDAAPAHRESPLHQCNKPGLLGYAAMSIASLLMCLTTFTAMLFYSANLGRIDTPPDMSILNDMEKAAMYFLPIFPAFLLPFFSVLAAYYSKPARLAWLVAGALMMALSFNQPWIQISNRDPLLDTALCMLHLLFIPFFLLTLFMLYRSLKKKPAGQ